MLDRLALIIVILGCIYLGIAGILNLELVTLTLNNPLSLLKRFIFAMTGVCGIWCCSFFFKSKRKHNIEV